MIVIPVLKDLYALYPSKNLFVLNAQKRGALCQIPKFTSVTLDETWKWLSA
jgi:hypothetical protein